MSHPDPLHDPENERENDEDRFDHEITRFHPAWDEYWKAREADQKWVREFNRKFEEMYK